MRRAPAKHVRACILRSGVLFHMSHLKLHFALHTPHFTLHSSHCTLLTAFFTLHTSHSHSTLHSSHCTLHSSHCTLHSSHCTLHAPHFTLHSSDSLQTTEEKPIRYRNDPSRNRRTHEVPFIAGCNHFTQKNTRFRAPPASSPKPMQHSCSHYNACCSITWQTCISLRTWQHQMATIMQPFQCDPQP